MTPQAHTAAISTHVSRHIGPVHTVFDEIVSDDLHLQIHYVKSSWFRRHEVLVTSGMSARPMAVPEGSEEPRFAEIVTVLPRSWPLTLESFSDERNYWPIRLMKDVARYTHHANTWIGFGHTVAKADSLDTLTPYAEGIGFCAAALLPPASLGEGAWCLKRGGRDDIFFWAAVPLYRQELEFKMEHGIDPLLDRFDTHRVTDRIDPARASVV